MLLSNLVKGSMCFEERFNLKVNQTKEQRGGKKRQCIFNKSVVVLQVLWYLSDLARYTEVYHQKAQKRKKKKLKIPSLSITSWTHIPFWSLQMNETFLPTPCLMQSLQCTGIQKFSRAKLLSNSNAFLAHLTRSFTLLCFGELSFISTTEIAPC